MKQKLSFEEAAARLEEIVGTMESGETSLEESLKLFEEGSALSSLCYRKLTEAEQKVREITEMDQKEGKTDEQD
ncbi:Exodeoxyribonuclease 7 small subunit [Caprobacter fermentans]|uniref:Exodeoxyribonuclease 7 small subunit n=1 Tax=Caproicibacter fermentans TaxID=2576756 RepID=A0A6N8I652_9FIRM|nr:exodeoxyribonuclease VII small subunit [Caproicibacter fermentans]MVB12983.1 Exodeoxyribonuclease 7 small subunit [Caproicibacter fermentans]OCN02482.1 exodeoxyribonuclease VII small subunit [Clostridium sp. W14A]QNK41252.1 exodeoxyribonuclease VII small subunit [Caproicibacter fermentans]